jgi:alpha-ribazole phosphatase
MDLWLVRHAQPLIAPGLCYGAMDIAADDAATRRAARELAAALPADLAVSHSPLRRCHQLALALQELRPDVTLHADPRLAEMDFGTWEGQPWNQLGAPALQAWTDDFAHHQPGGGESVQDFMARVAQAWNESCSPVRTGAWITHAGVIRAASLLARGVTTLRHAHEWPATAPGFGEWCVVQAPWHP